MCVVTLRHHISMPPAQPSIIFLAEFLINLFDSLAAFSSPTLRQFGLLVGVLRHALAVQVSIYHCTGDDIIVSHYMHYISLSLEFERF